MSDNAWYTGVVLAIALVFVVALGAGMGLGGDTGSAPSAPSATSGAPTTVDSLYLTVAFNPQSGLDEYFPANFSVPAGVLVEITITNYDNGTNPVPAAAAQVSGTVSGTASYLNTSNGHAVTLAGVPLDHIAHTFSLMQPPYNLNVPIPSSASLSLPEIVVFGAYFNTTGSFVWLCQAPCDSDAMASLGFMTGTVTVL